MDRSNEIHELLDEIRSASGEGFQCDEAAVEKEVIEHDALFTGIGIKILSIIGGFAAGIVFLVFLFLAGIIDSESGMLVTGFLFIAASLAISKLVKNIVLDAATVSMFVIGCVLSTIGMIDNTDQICWFFLLIALISAAVTDNYILVFISVLLFNAGLAGFFITYDAIPWIHLLAAILSVALAVVCSAEAFAVSFSAKTNRLFKPVVAGMFVSTAVCLIAVALTYRLDLKLQYVWILSLCIWGTVMWLLRSILQTFDSMSRKAAIVFYLVFALILLPTWYAPAVSGALLMMLLAFRFNYKPAFAMSVALLIYVLIQYYYDLGITLLVKSGILFFSGILFLVIRMLFQKMIKKDEAI